MSKEISRDNQEILRYRNNIIEKIEEALGHHSSLPLFNVTREGDRRYGYSVVRNHNLKQKTIELSFERYDVTRLEEDIPTEIIIRSYVFSEDGSDRIHINKVEGLKAGDDDSFDWHRLRVRQGLDPKPMHSRDYPYVLNELTMASALVGIKRRFKKINTEQSN